MSDNLFGENQNQEPIIEIDGQGEEDTTSDEQIKYPYDPEKTDIDIREEKCSIYQYMRWYEQGRLVIDPDYQRNLVWKDHQKSRFIESIILGFPLPPFYVNQQRNGNYTIIDGLQRTTTLHQFLDNKFQLKNLKELPNFNNKIFAELPKPIKAKIEDKNLLLYVLKPSVPAKVVYELFDRINTGGTPLNQQEVRNCIFLGKSTQILKEFSEMPIFRQAIDNGVSPTRMKDREIVLRYLSFQIFHYENDYKGDLDEFLGNAMRKMNDMNEDEIQRLKDNFVRVMTLTLDFFGNENFRFPILDKDNKLNRGFINTSLMESVCYFFAHNSDDFLKENKQKIIENMKLLLTDSTYRNATRTSTASRRNVSDRFKLAQEILQKAP